MVRVRYAVFVVGCCIAFTSSLWAQPTIQTSSPLPGAVLSINYSTQFTATGGFPGNYNWFFVVGQGNPPPGLSLNQQTGVLAGTPTAVGTFNFTIRVTDAAMQSGTKAFSLTVTTPPPVSITTFTLPGGTVTVPYSAQMTATGGSGNPANYQWNTDGVLPPGVNFNAQGAFSGTPTAVGSYTFTISVFDVQSKQGANTNLTITIGVCIPTFVTTSPLPGWDVNIPYTQVFQAMGCSGQYTFASAQNPFSSNNLPHGLSLSSGGVLTGTPDTVGTYNFIVTVTDAGSAAGAGGGQASSGFSLTINPLPSISTVAPIASGTEGKPYSQQFAAAGGVPPYVFIGTNLPNGFSMSSTGLLTSPAPVAGIYNIYAGVTDSLKVTSQLTLYVLTINGSTPSVQASPPSLTFNAIAGGSAPPPQTLSVSPAPNFSGPATFRVLVDSGQNNVPPSFALTVNPTSGTAPASLAVSADQGTITGGTSTARIRIIDSGSLETDVPVSLTVTSGQPAQLQALPTRLHFTASASNPAVLEQSLAISNSGGSGSIAFSISVLNGSFWVASVTPSSGQTTRNASVFVKVRIDTHGLQRSDNDVLRISYAGGHTDIPVSVFLVSDGPIIGTNVTGVLLQAQQGGGFTNTQTIKVFNRGSAGTTVNWTARLLSGEDILAFSTTSGTATPGTPGLFIFTLKPSALQLAPGGHYALVSLEDPQAQGSPALLVVVLNLAAAGSPSLPDLSPGGMFFAVVAGGAQSAPQTETVNTSGASAVPFQVSISTDDGGSWLIASTTSGRASGQGAGSFTLAVDPSHLTPSVHTAQASVLMANAVRSVVVTVVVLQAANTVSLPSANGSTVESTIQPHASGCTPSRLVLTGTALVNNFSVPAKWPVPLVAQLNDDCGSLVSNGSVTASFSNGDAPLALQGNAPDGTYAATWQPNGVAAQTVVTLTATSPTLPQTTLQVIGGVSANPSGPPSLNNGGTVNTFYPVQGGALAPGTLVGMLGSGLATVQSYTGSAPMPLTFAGTSVLIGGLQAPLLYVSGQELEVQIPVELPANQQTLVLVNTNGALSLPDQLDLVPLQPSVLSFPDGACGVPVVPEDCYIHIVAQHTDSNGTVVDAAHPAAPGEVLVVYLLGMGPTNPSVASGAPAPQVEPLARVTNQPTVTVDGESATVQYAGLTPTYAGLYQIQFMVPKDARTGELQVVITQNGVPANKTKLYVSR